MFSNILVPVDLEHLDKLEKALAVAADLARHYGATLCYVGVTTSSPSAVAHTPAEFGQKLEAVAVAEGEKRGIATRAVPLVSHDPTVDLDKTLLKAVDELKADAVVMGTHLPGLAEHFFTSHGGALAAHAKVSVFLVR